MCLFTKWLDLNVVTLSVKYHDKARCMYVNVQHSPLTPWRREGGREGGTMGHVATCGTSVLIPMYCFSGDTIFVVLLHRLKFL